MVKTAGTVDALDTKPKSANPGSKNKILILKSVEVNREDNSYRIRLVTRAGVRQINIDSDEAAQIASDLELALKVIQAGV